MNRKKVLECGGASYCGRFSVVMGNTLVFVMFAVIFMEQFSLLLRMERCFGLDHNINLITI